MFSGEKQNTELVPALAANVSIYHRLEQTFSDVVVLGRELVETFYLSLWYTRCS